MSSVLAQHNSFAQIVSAALGGGKDTRPPRAGQDGVKDLAAGHGSVEDAVAAINRAMLI